MKLLVEFLKEYEKKEVTTFPNSVPVNPVVSVCVQTYNHEPFIAKCLDGILMQQTNFSFEILLGEDSSSDGTREVCVKYAEKHPEKIKLFLHHRENNIKINNSATGRFNFMYNVLSSKGKYIAMCEGDDYWTDPLKLQKQIDFLEKNTSYGICFHDIMIYDEAAQKIKDDDIIESTKDTYDINDLALGNFMHTPSVVLRNDFVIPSWFSKSPIGDWPLYVFQIGSRKIRKLEGKMAVYRVHENGVWSTKSERIRITETIKVVNFLLKNLHFSSPVRKIFKRQRKKMKRHLRKTKFPLYLKFRYFYRKK